MPVSDAARNYWSVCAGTAIVSTAWAALLVLETGGPTVAQALSNVGQVAAAFAAAVGCALAARRDIAHRRTWALLGAAVLSWGAGQTLWTWYESILGREVPFPSLADLGFLGLIPLVVAALVSLPAATVSAAGRIRTVLDGLMIAGALLLTSWLLVLDTVIHAAEGTVLAQAISFAYPIGDVVIATIVLSVFLRQRGRNGGSFPIGLIAAGLVAFAIADSGFLYLTATGAYASGALIDIGWFVSFMLILIAACRPLKPATTDEASGTDGRRLGLLLPYAAVLIALTASSVELLRTGSVDSMVSWITTFTIAAMVIRQVLTLFENAALTHHLHARMDEMRAGEQRFQALVQHSSDVVTVIDSSLVVRYQSESVERVFGYLADALVDRPLADLLDGESAVEVGRIVEELAAEPYGIRVLELNVRHRSGRLCHAEMTVTNLLDNPSVRGVVLNYRDISERKSLEEQLVHSAYHDSLTTLANRARFRERVDETLQELDSPSEGISVLFLDLDGFKQVNDLLGHAAGDLLLVQVANRLRTCVRPNDIVARLGGDEFGVLLEQADDRIAVAAARRITEALRVPFTVEGQEINVRGSVGIAAGGVGIDGDGLLRNADLAMYRAKAAGEGGFKRYDPDMHVDLVERLQLEADLRRAIDAEQLVLHYQPTVVLETGEITGVEALVRWNHPTRGLVSPGRFIPIAEESGLIVPMGRWVLREACRQAVEWQRGFRGRLLMSVNISGGQLSPGFDDVVAGTLAETGLDASCLVLEMTESVLMENTDDILELFKRLKDIGVGIAIDDFGTGYSSLSYLHRFPVDVLKIDQSFIERLGQSDHESELVHTIVRLGQSLQMHTIAEGVEDLKQVNALRSFDCEFGQGFHFSRPLPAADLGKLLAAVEPAQPRKQPSAAAA